MSSGPGGPRLTGGSRLVRVEDAERALAELARCSRILDELEARLAATSPRARTRSAAPVGNGEREAPRLPDPPPASVEASARAPARNWGPASFSIVRGLS